MPILVKITRSNKMNIAVTGLEGGMVRDKLVKMGCTPINADITLEDELKSEIFAINPDVIIHAAAVTDVDKCEHNKKLAFEVNVRGTSYVAEASVKVGAKLIYLSTCHVFNGNSKNAYIESSIPRPINNYGMTKWMGEVTASTFAPSTLVVRISKLFSMKTFVPFLDKEEVIRPTFIFRNYIHINHFCDALLDVARQHYNFPGIINLSSLDGKNDFEFFKSAFQYLVAVPTERFKLSTELVSVFTNIVNDSICLP